MKGTLVVIFRNTASTKFEPAPELIITTSPLQVLLQVLSDKQRFFKNFVIH